MPTRGSPHHRERFAIKFADAIVRPQPQIAVFVFSNARHRVRRQSVLLGKPGERFTVVSSRAVRYRPKPKMALAILVYLNNVGSNTVDVFRLEIKLLRDPIRY